MNDVNQWIKTYLKPIKTINRQWHSYGLKHMCERMIGRYVSEAEMKEAMIKEGYISHKKDKYPWHFNISNKNMENIYLFSLGERSSL